MMTTEIPRVPGASNTSMEPSAAQQGLGDGLRSVLIADDEHLIATSLASSLSERGVRVIGPVANGQQALDLARQDTPDLALLDIRMPILNGFEAAKALWKEMQTPSMIVSAYSDPRDIDEAARVGVFGYLVKPVDLDNLRASVAVAWSRAKAARAQTERIAQLEKNLANRRVVEQAKWRLVAALGVEEPEAHNRLQKAARSSRTPIAEVAQRVLDGDVSGV